MVKNVGPQKKAHLGFDHIASGPFIPLLARLWLSTQGQRVTYFFAKLYGLSLNN